jgi:hypothetical protein
VFNYELLYSNVMIIIRHIKGRDWSSITTQLFTTAKGLGILSIVDLEYWNIGILSVKLSFIAT